MDKNHFLYDFFKRKSVVKDTMKVMSSRADVLKY